MTKFRILMLCLAVCCLAAVFLGIHLLERHGKFRMAPLCKVLLGVGLVLVLDTVVVSFLSNFNLGVILPAFFGVPLIALAFLLPHMHHGFLLFLKWFTAGCYAVALCIFLVCGILMTNAAHRGDHREADAVIVLGAAVHGDRVTWVLSNRLDAAIDYLEAHPDAIAVVSGGQGPGETVTEGSAMRKYMIGHGIDESRVYAEERATNTGENFRYSMEIVRDVLGPDADIAFVTTGFHVYRAGGVAAAQGIDAFGIPADDVWYLAVNNFMRECVGICVYALTGAI